jgi:large subunit ribosomal protein L43
MNAFLKHTLPPFAATHPSIEIIISPLQGGPNSHPSIMAHYVNGRSKSISARNLEPGEILGKVRLLRDSDGTKNRRVRGSVVQVGGGTEEGVRGVWSGLHEGVTRKI